MMKRPVKLLLLGLSVLGLSSCGYTTRSMISDQYKTVYITPFVNTIDITQEGASGDKYQLNRPLTETEVTKAVSNRYLFDGNLKPVKETSADMILVGQLVQFRKDPLRYADNSDDVTEYRVNIVVNLEMWDNTGPEKKLLWSEPGFTGETSYFVTGAQAISEDQAVQNSITDLARRVVERTVEQW
jgi:hypothetical protein